MTITPIPAEPNALLLRAYLGESDHWQHKPLYESIVLKARECHLAGATVVRGPLGYGRTSHLHTAKLLRLSDDLPLIVEIVDTAVKIEAFLPTLRGMMPTGLVTVESIRIIPAAATGTNEAEKTDA